MLVRRVWPARPTFSPFGDFEHLRRDMLRWLDSVSGDGKAQTGAGVFPPINVTEDADSYLVCAEVPGLKADELSISALRNQLSVSGKRELPQERERVSYHRKERAEGSFSRTVVLPNEIDAARVDAHYANGILTVTLPKAEAAKPRQITVRS